MMKNEKGRIILLLVKNENMDSIFEEMGICLIASFLRNKGYLVKLIAIQEKQLDYQELKDFNPDIIGFTVYTINKDTVNESINKICMVRPKTRIAIGGIYATYDGQGMMEENKNIDFCIRGVGEETFLELAEAVRKKEKSFKHIDGLTYRTETGIFHNKDRTPNENLDDFPFAARDFLEISNLKIVKISGSRGCTARCTFCANQLYYKRWYGRSINNILDEMEEIIERYQVRQFMFDDSSFEDPYRDLRRLKEFVYGIQKRRLKIYYYFNIRADFYKKVDDDFMKLLVKSGLRAVGLGLEAGNRDDIGLYNKAATLDDNYNIINFLRKYNIQCYIGFINFNAYTTIDSLEENLKFLKFAKMPFLFLTELDIYRGTRIFEKIKNDNLIKDKCVCGKYIYKYINNDVENLVQFLFTYTGRVNDTNNQILKTLEGYYKRIPLQIFCINSSSQESNINNVKNKIIKRCVEKYVRNSESCCEHIFNWYEKLLMSIKMKGFDFDHCMLLSNEYLNIEALFKIQNEFIKISQLLSEWL